ncbi:MAG: PorT family protein [Bacteroidales bacterium]|jgi:hypothetical protein|nr:PorT family protein [Bacteroidales bacterium]
MKRNIFFITLFSFIISVSFAQNKNTNWSYGVKAGVNLSFMSRGDLDRDIFSSDVMLGFNGGFKVAYNFTPVIGISSELVVSTQNYSMIFIAGYSDEGEKWLGNIRYYTTNLSIPLLLTVNINRNFTVEVGAQYSYKLFVRDLLDCPYMAILITYPHYSYKEFSAKVFNRSDVSGILGLSYKFNSKFGLSLRYMHGFIPAVETIKFNVGKPDNAANVLESIDRDFNPLLRSVQLYFEYTF